jgi:hypothetical protein
MPINAQGGYPPAAGYVDTQLEASAMAASGWIVSLFRVSDFGVQQLILGLLGNVDELVAVGCVIGCDPHIAVETMEAGQATASCQFIVAIDPHAVLLDTANRHPVLAP